MKTIQKFIPIIIGTKIKRFGAFLIFQFFILSIFSIAFAQFTIEGDTLLIFEDDSTTVTGFTYDASADTTNGTPYTGYTAGIDLNGKHLVGVDFDTTSSWTAAKFGIQTSATYNDDADTTGGTPYDWKTINYEGTVYTFTPETAGINYLDPKAVYALKRYVRFICQDSGGNWETEAGPRKMVPLLRSGF